MTINEIIAREIEPQAWAALGLADTLAYKNRRVSSERKAQRILAALQVAGYRILGPDADDPATTIYGRLLHSHRAAAREAFDGERRKQIFDLIEAFRAEFPAECQAWEDKYAPATRAMEAER